MVDHSAGKVVTTFAGLVTAAMLLAQIQPADEDVLVENWVGMPRAAGIAHTGFDIHGTVQEMSPTSNLANNLCQGQKESSFFTPKRFASSGGVITAANMAGSALQGAGARLQVQVNSPEDRKQVLNDFTAAAEAVPGAKQGKAVKEGYQKPDGTLKTAMLDSKFSAPFKLNPQTTPGSSNPSGCGPQGTVNEYTGQRLMGADFSFPKGKTDVPTENFTTDSFSLGTMDFSSYGGPQNVYMADRLVYSTLQRKRCAGTVDMIRGDLPIPKGAQMSAPAGTAADTLEAGAFAAIFGNSVSTGEQTAVLQNEETLGAYQGRFGGGSNLAYQTAELAAQKQRGEAPLGATPATFGVTAAAQVLEGASLSGSNKFAAGVDSARGGAAVGRVYTGATSFP